MLSNCLDYLTDFLNSFNTCSKRTWQECNVAKRLTHQFKGGFAKANLRVPKFFLQDTGYILAYSHRHHCWCNHCEDSMAKPFGLKATLLLPASTSKVYQILIGYNFWMALDVLLDRAHLRVTFKRFLRFYRIYRMDSKYEHMLYHLLVSKAHHRSIQVWSVLYGITHSIPATHTFYTRKGRETPGQYVSPKSRVYQRR